MKKGILFLIGGSLIIGAVIFFYVKNKKFLDATSSTNKLA